MGKWYRIVAKAESADIYIYDEIGMWGVTAQAFTNALQAVKDKASLNLYLNSPGGDVFEGMAIYNALFPLKDKLTVHVMGLAASMASVVMLAASHRIVYTGAMVMIHNPWGCALGTAGEMRKTAETLDKITDQIVDIYANAIGRESDEIRRLMDDETWFNASEAMEIGFATEETEVEAAASLKRKYAMKFHHAPSEIVVEDEPTVREAEEALRDAGFSDSRAKAILAKGFSLRDGGEADHRDGGQDFAPALKLVAGIRKNLEVF